MSRLRTRERSDNTNNTEPVSEEHAEEDACPVCYVKFGGRRGTKSYPFACKRHAVCVDCNRKMFTRHADACPLCRATRVDTARMGERGPAPPRNDNFRLLEASEIAQAVFGNSDAFTEVPASNVSAVLFAMPAHPGARSGMIVVQHNFSEDESAPSSAAHVVDQIARDPGVRAAIEGLRNPSRVRVGSFLSHIRRAARRGPR